MMKYNLGDEVVIVNQPDGVRENMVGLTGKIIDVDPEWHYPYEIAFADGIEREACLFADEDLELLSVVEEEVKKANGQYFININWQEGTVEENGVNGVQIEDVIDILVERLTEFQKGAFPCRENALAITHLQEAQNWLYRRTMERKKQGIEGKHVNHEKK
jgi:hypothetical protein